MATRLLKAILPAIVVAGVAVISTAAGAAPCPSAGPFSRPAAVPAHNLLHPASAEQLLDSLLAAVNGGLAPSGMPVGSAAEISAGMGQWMTPGGDLDGSGADDVLHVQLNPPSLTGLRGIDGAPLWTTSFTGFVFPMEGLVLDTVAGEDLLVAEVTPRFTPPNLFEIDYGLHGISGSTGATLWKAQYRNRVIPTPAGPVVLEMAGMTSARDLDGDGTLEILIARYQQAPAQKLAVASYEILSSRDGRVVGTLDPVVQVDGASLPFAFATPDFTGDGLADIVSAAFTREEMFVKGHVGLVRIPVWTSRVPLEGRVLSWVVSAPLDAGNLADVLFGFRCASAPAAETKLHALSGVDGSALWNLAYPAGYAYPQAVAPGAGGNDLLMTSLTSAGPRFALLDGATGGVLWTRNLVGGYWPYVGDATGDTVPDLLSIAPDAHRIVSGSDGSIAWTRPAPEDGREVVWPVGGDLDGNGADDLLMGHDRSDETVDFSPISGRTGAEMWPSRVDFLRGPLYGEAVDLRPDVPGMDLLESFWSADHSGGFAARPGPGGPPLWTRPA